MTGPLDTCPTCGSPWLRAGPASETLVGHRSPPGHDHNDNCINRRYLCEQGHERSISVVRQCHTCDWSGKTGCWCHPDPKLDHWPPAIELDHE